MGAHCYQLSNGDIPSPIDLINWSVVFQQRGFIRTVESSR